MRIHGLLLVVSVMLVAGCSKSSSPANDSHAVGAKVGSYDDWCGEHAVPESQCTRCHPELAAAFKATHDWCEEHGLPESHCLQCNPNRPVVRPPRAP